MNDRSRLSLVKKIPLTTVVKIKNRLQKTGVSVSISTMNRRFYHNKYTIVRCKPLVNLKKGKPGLELIRKHWKHLLWCWERKELLVFWSYDSYEAWWMQCYGVEISANITDSLYLLMMWMLTKSVAESKTLQNKENMKTVDVMAWQSNIRKETRHPVMSICPRLIVVTDCKGIAIKYLNWLFNLALCLLVQISMSYQIYRPMYANGCNSYILIVSFQTYCPGIQSHRTLCCSSNTHRPNCIHPQTNGSALIL